MGPQGLDPLFFEFANLALGTLAALVVMIFGHYLATEYYKDTFRPLDWWHGQAMLRHQMAIALATMAGGESALRFWTWWARLAANMGWEAGWMILTPYYLVPRVAVLLQCWGMICAVKVFAPDAWGGHAKVWISCVGAVLLEFIATILLHH